ncbi:Gliding motility lipoprotein precursor GldH [Tenacibaculum sp. 190130A14a]|uniref:Gliding motility lipoprotein GldH homolog n=1 Tax=Tenacibaculum polynesiense TaxID=3137857 RepID=A0ABM9P9Z5_9FLAO
MLETKKNSIYVFMALIFFSLTSCDSKQEFDEYTSIPKGAWNKDNTVAFLFSINDTIQKKNLFINLRNNKNYPFSNLFLIAQIDFPDGQKIVDTLEYDMTDVTGKFLGKGFSDIKENKLFYKENITFPKSGEYTFKVRQSMRKNGEVHGVESLEGVTDVGFRIEKTQ